MAAVTSPTSASPGLSLLEWDEGAVCDWLGSIGLAQYMDSIYEQGITGDVLSVMDHTSLQELGMGSIGHRLTLLRNVWEIKRDQGIEFGEDDWKPQDAGVAEPVKPVVQSAQLDRLWDTILEQQERLTHLEQDQVRILSALGDYGITVPVASSADGDVMHGLPPADKGHNPWRGFGGNGRGSDGEEPEAGPSRGTRRASQIFPSSLASSANSYLPPLSSDSATFQDSFTPPAVSASYPFESPSQSNGGDKSSLVPSKPPPLTRLMSGSSIMQSTNSPSSSTSTPPITNGRPLLVPSAMTASSSAITPNPTVSDKDRSRAKDAAHSAAKSFRVTLEDPCWKVLPAALKKYKINDDWKMYALFICFGNTERCLSYDEKPLMLFQKLKENGQKPVFMLRHIKDIKSPIAVAQQKQAVKLGLPPNTTVNVLPKIKPATDTSISPTKAGTGSLQPGSRGADDGQTPSGGAFPELPSPGLREGEPAPQKVAPGAGTLVDKDGNVTNVTYAVAIYPYIADRQDEFDVAVGATFVILSKAKGWYIVQKDPVGSGKIVPDQSKSGWVPAGCLLEISSPISISTPAASEVPLAYPGLAPLPPSTIMSSSYPGVVLMEYEAKGDNELTLKEGDKVRVYKKYCHWSYTIKEDSGERGWVPAWFIGKLGSSSSNGSESQPSSAATPTGPISGGVSASGSGSTVAVENPGDSGRMEELQGES
ncbi:hypothetical protein BCR39DRAFT_552741 [Naematelia encephala]|uniref:Protein kinase regulator n=1 Tax=Naematelia encephala TaxID=71784 RepID=A0A1Y2AHU6_9TREE|nr:hypothetical protein BCR39DRAFT_552741 [Naematelia encephala]